jgi:pilus assembly protein CpaD
MRMRILYLLALSGLAGCATALEGPPPPETYDQIYPISLRMGTVRLEVDARRPVLTAEQENAVQAFASRALAVGPEFILLGHPDTNDGNAVAARVSQILVNAGIRPGDIRAGRAEGGMVVASFPSQVAVTRPCGDWTVQAVGNAENKPSQDFGCITQQNLAAMVARPSDLAVPRAPTLRRVNGKLAAPAKTASASDLVGTGN